MEYNILNITGGLFLLALLSYILISIYTYFYTKFASKKEIKKKRFYLSVGIVSLAWVVATLITVAFASSQGILIFATTSFVLLFGLNYYLSGLTFGFRGKDKILYSLALAVIINPTWYFILV